jgi:hypothetical protein
VGLDWKTGVFVKRKDVIILVGFILFFGIVYLPVVFAVYAFTDDYFGVYQGITRHLNGVTEQIVVAGRPIYAALFYCSFHFMSRIGDLGWLRAIGVAGIAAVAMATWLAAERTSLARPLTIAVALLVGLMPPFQVYAAWAVTAFYPWAALSAIFAFQSIDGDEGHPQTIYSIILGFFLLVASLAIYQPASTMFWFCAGLSWLSAPKLPSLCRIARCGLVMAGALLADYTMAKVLPYFYGDFVPATRASIATDFLPKMWWFIGQPLQDALNLPLIQPSILGSLIVATFILTGLWLSGEGSWKARIARISLAVALLPLSYLPNLVINVDWTSYRTEIGLASLVLFYVATASVGWLRWARLEQKLPIVAGATVLACSALAVGNIVYEVILPQTKEYQLVTAYLGTNYAIGHARQLYLIQARRQDTLAPFVRYDEFGIPSSCQIWVLRGMAWLILRDLKSPAAALIATSQVGSGRLVPPGYTIVDFGKALHG